MQQRSDREAFWLKNERRRLTHEMYAIRRINRAFRTQLETVMSAVNESGAGAVLATLPSFIDKEQLTGAFIDIYSRVGSDFAEQVFEGMKSALPQIERKDMAGVRDHWRDHMDAFVRTKAGKRITQINKTTLERVRDTLTQAHNEGLGIDEIARSMSQSTAFSTARSRTIARTEIVSASNEGNLMGARETGLELKKMWIATPDERTRQAHWDADGGETELNGKFIVDGEQMDYPGDVNGSAGNVINCRCAVSFIPPSYEDI